MNIWVLAENTSCREDMQAEHGLSLYIETETNQILFDAGQSDVFFIHAQRLGIDLSRANAAVLSHGHYDHGDGLVKFFAVNERALVYAHPGIFGEYYNGHEKYIGLSKAVKESGRFCFLEGENEILSGMTLHSFPAETLPEPVLPWGLTEKRDGQWIPDAFTHEQYLLIEEEGKRILISGCSHKGIVNLVSHFRPDVAIGGFHLKSCTDENLIRETARRLSAFPTHFYTGHCTGDFAYGVMKEIMGDRLDALSTGKKIVL